MDDSISRHTPAASVPLVVEANAPTLPTAPLTLLFPVLVSMAARSAQTQLLVTSD